MKNSLLIVFISLSGLLFPQTYGVTTLDHDTCLDKKFSVVFYVVLDSNYSPGVATPSQLTKLIDTMNTRFRRICVSFQSCSTVYIPTYPFNKWTTNVVDPVVTLNWYTDSTINFYIIDSIYQTGSYTGDKLGDTYPPPINATIPPKDVIVMQRDGLLGSFPYVFHQLGHYFGLVHTSAEIGTGPSANPPPAFGVASQEFVDGTNCGQHGDCLCDTEADSGNNTVAADGNGVRYITPLDNYMCMFEAGCRYSQQQYNLMAHIMMTKRLYLH